MTFSHICKSLLACTVLLMAGNAFAKNIVERLKGEGYQIVSAYEKRIEGPQYEYDVTFKNNYGHTITFGCDAIYKDGKNLDTASVRCEYAPHKVDDQDVRALIRAAKK